MINFFGSVPSSLSWPAKFLHCIWQQPGDKFTREEKYNEDEDNNDVGDNSDEEKAGGDDDAVDDHQDEAEYLLGDEGPTTTEVSIFVFFLREIFSLRGILSRYHLCIFFC